MKNIDAHENIAAINLRNNMAKTYLDFTAYLWRRHEELNPGYIKLCEDYLNKLPRKNPFQATSDKPPTTKKHEGYKSRR